MSVLFSSLVFACGFLGVGFTCAVLATRAAKNMTEQERVETIGILAWFCGIASLAVPLLIIELAQRSPK